MGYTWCRTCGKEYKVCPTCAEIRTYTPWRTICCTADHYKIWLAVEQYRKGVIDKKTAKEQLCTIGFNNDESATFIPAVQDIIKDILAEDIKACAADVCKSKKVGNVGSGKIAVKNGNKNKGRTK